MADKVAKMTKILKNVLSFLQPYAFTLVFSLQTKSKK